MRNRLGFESSGELSSSDGMGVPLEQSASPSYSCMIEVALYEDNRANIQRMFFETSLDITVAKAIGFTLLDDLLVSRALDPEKEVPVTPPANPNEYNNDGNDEQEDDGNEDETMEQLFARFEEVDGGANG